MAAAGSGADDRRGPEAARLRDRRDGQVGPRAAGVGGRPAEARLRPLLRLQLPAPGARLLPDLPLRRRPARRARQPRELAAPEARCGRGSARPRELCRLLGQRLRARRHLGARPRLHPREPRAAVLRLPADDAAAPRAAGARGLARRVPRPLPRNAVPRRQGVPAAPDAAGGLRRDGDAPRPRGRADPRPARRARARGAHDRRLHLGQRPHLRRRRRRLGLLPLGGSLPRPEGLALRGRPARAGDRELEGPRRGRRDQRSRHGIRGLAADAARAGRGGVEDAAARGRRELRADAARPRAGAAALALSRARGLRRAADGSHRRLDRRPPGPREAGRAAARALRSRERRRPGAGRRRGAPRRRRAARGRARARAPAVAVLPARVDRPDAGALRRSPHDGRAARAARRSRGRMGCGAARPLGARRARHELRGALVAARPRRALRRQRPVAVAHARGARRAAVDRGGGRALPRRGRERPLVRRGRVESGQRRRRSLDRPGRRPLRPQLERRRAREPRPPAEGRGGPHDRLERRERAALERARGEGAAGHRAAAPGRRPLALQRLQDRAPRRPIGPREGRAEPRLGPDGAAQLPRARGVPRDRVRGRVAVRVGLPRGDARRDGQRRHGPGLRPRAHGARRGRGGRARRGGPPRRAAQPLPRGDAAVAPQPRGGARSGRGPARARASSWPCACAGAATRTAPSTSPSAR